MAVAEDDRTCWSEEMKCAMNSGTTGGNPQETDDKCHKELRKTEVHLMCSLLQVDTSLMALQPVTVTTRSTAPRTITHRAHFSIITYLEEDWGGCHYDYPHTFRHSLHWT